ncbi:MAG TPA: SpoVG family protein [Methylomirabilota bacterium]|nr:SpoVG family protein [Methylomirabilota bacterium]
MKVTEVRISPARGGRIRAFASIVIDDCFIVNDLRVMEGREQQLFVTMPARKARNGQMRDIAHPLNQEAREEVERRVLEEYEIAVQNLAVPEPETTEKGRHGREESMMDRLTAKLFSDDYWTVEVNRRSLDAE